MAAFRGGEDAASVRLCRRRRRCTNVTTQILDDSVNSVRPNSARDNSPLTMALVLLTG